MHLRHLIEITRTRNKPAPSCVAKSGCRLSGCLLIATASTVREYSTYYDELDSIAKPRYDEKLPDDQYIDKHFQPGHLAGNLFLVKV